MKYDFNKKHQACPCRAGLVLFIQFLKTRITTTKVLQP